MPRIQRTKDQIREAFEKGYSKGVNEGRVQGGAAGFVAGVAVIGGALFLTRGKGGAILQRLGLVEDLIPKPKVPAATTQRIMESVFGETPAPRHTPKIPRDPKTGKPKEMVQEVVDAPEAKYFVRRSASKAEKQTPEEFFQKGEMKGIRKRDRGLERIRETLSPEEPVSPVGPQSSLGGQNIIALAEPNTTIVPVPVGGGTQIIGGGGASPYQAAAKYAQMMSQITV
jgi:hypothetical protein